MTLLITHNGSGDLLCTAIGCTNRATRCGHYWSSVSPLCEQYFECSFPPCKKYYCDDHELLMPGTYDQVVWEPGRWSRANNGEPKREDNWNPEPQRHGLRAPLHTAMLHGWFLLKPLNEYTEEEYAKIQEIANDVFAVEARSEGRFDLANWCAEIAHHCRTYRQYPVFRGLL